MKTNSTITQAQFNNFPVEGTPPVSPEDRIRAEAPLAHKILVLTEDRTRAEAPLALKIRVPTVGISSVEAPLGQKISAISNMAFPWRKTPRLCCKSIAKESGQMNTIETWSD
jgi:hypothetical protein